MFEFINFKNRGSIWFKIITGVVRLNKARGFSHDNSSVDISSNESYKICGITKKELF